MINKYDRIVHRSVNAKYGRERERERKREEEREKEREKEREREKEKKRERNSENLGQILKNGQNNAKTVKLMQRPSK